MKLYPIIKIQLLKLLLTQIKLIFIKFIDLSSILSLKNFIYEKKKEKYWNKLNEIIIYLYLKILYIILQSKNNR